MTPSKTFTSGPWRARDATSGTVARMIAAISPPNSSASAHTLTELAMEANVARSSPIAEVAIDPDGDVLLADRTLDDEVRVDGDRHAAWRATARLTSWTQALMQVVGL